ncbi:putative endonuclease containing a URI domain [Novosphingobium sp. AP12]|nr:putative endonuclease containing a URI domain [Novosphingobium sp. AP12]
MLEKHGTVYIMASQRNGTLYIGVTSDLRGRVWQHKEGTFDGFTKKYGCKHLVWYAVFDRVEDAIRREKQMKEWRRAWKLRIVEEMNPDWNDLFESIF